MVFVHFRIVNTANMNVANIGGKPVLISGKLPGNVASLIRSSSTVTTSGNKLSMATASSAAREGASPSPDRGTTNLLIGNQTLKVPSSINASTNSSLGATQHLMIGNQLVRIQSSGNSGAGNVTVKGDREVAASTTTGPKAVIVNANVGQTYKVQSLVQNQGGKIIKVSRRWCFLFLKVNYD